MARSGSVPLLLLPLLLSSAVANVYQRLANVTGAYRDPGAPMAAESDCANSCNAGHWCRGYTFDGSMCELYKQDCRGPVSLDQPAPTNYMAKVACPVVLQSYHVTAVDGTAPLGQTALLTCHVPDHVRATVRVISWSVNDGVNVYPTLLGDDKYHMLPSGELLVRDVTHDDVTSRFLCRTVHLMTDQHVISQQSARVVIREPAPVSGGGAPVIVGSSSTLHVREGDDLVLFCVAQSDDGLPPPLSWSREVPGRTDPLPLPVAGHSDVTARGHVLVIQSSRPAHSGRYQCRAENSLGHVTTQLHLQVQVTLTVSVSPERLTVNRGESFHLSCSAPQPAQLHWLKDGHRLESGRRLTITSELSEDRVLSRLEGAEMMLTAQGMYQCFASDQHDSAQAAAQVLLGDSQPVLLERFINHTVQPFSAVSLRCVANASPTPQITWLLDGYPLTPDHRRLIGQYVGVNNDVISHVNMSAALPADGGWVTCRASNRFGSATHTARLNVYGEPQVRTMPDVLAVAGEALLLTCSVGGYPILEISWDRGGRRLPSDRQQHLFSNGSLLLERVDKESGGQYSCTGTGPGGSSSTGHLTVSVVAPPTIRPFLLGNYSVGERVQVLCFVQSGDGPVTLSWLRDGRPLDDPEVKQHSTDGFSSSLSIGSAAVRHAGNYTCRAENPARAASYTAQLRVNVPPRWLLEPSDTAVRRGAAVLLPCSAAGSPPPRIAWTKAEASGEIPAGTVPGVALLPNGSLAIASAAPAHQGLYTCRVSNDVGPPLTARPQLTVYAAPSFVESSTTQRHREGENVTLVCRPLGDEPLSVQWFRESRPLPEGLRVLVRPLNTSGSSLLLLRAVASDSGQYSCRASNGRGTADRAFQLEIEETPLPPSRVQVVEVLSRSITVEWQQPAKVSRHLTGYRIQYKPTAGDWESAVSAVLSGRRVRLTGLLPDTEYSLRPLAVTPLGAGPPGRPVHVRTEPAPPSAPPADLTLVPLTATEVKATWRPPPAETHHGRLTGYKVTYHRENASSSGTTGGSAELNTSTLSMSLLALRPFSVYSVTVAACNGRGCGPGAPPGRVRTLEDVPAAAPGRLRCRPLGSRRLAASWAPPPAERLNGNLRGYKVKTEATQERDGELFYSELDVTQAEVTLSDLRPHVNYSLRVAAVTGVGAGIFSQPVFCTTLQDVPSEPATVSVAVESERSALISWLPPEHPNGELVSYSVYIRAVSPTAAASEERVSVPIGSTVYPLSGLSRRGDYAVRVTAHTAAGEGLPSRPVPFSTALSGPVPVQLVSLSRPVSVDEGSTLSLACRHVGAPTLTLTWERDGQLLDDPRFRRRSDDSLQLHDVTRADDGNYTCRVANDNSSGAVTYAVTVLGVPPAPSLLVRAALADSVTVRWSSGDPHGLVIRGYRLQYWPAGGTDQPAEVGLERFVREYTLTGLTCGTDYHLQLRAFNRLGASEPSTPVRVRTAGRAPALADPARLLTANTTAVTVLLALWTAADCPVTRFAITWRPAHGAADNMSVELSGDTRQHVIRRLLPATAYVISVTAVSPAGEVSHAAEVVTPGAADAGASSGAADLAPTPAAPFGLRVLVPVLASLLSLLMLSSAAYLCFRKRRRKVPLYLPEPADFSTTGKGAEPPSLPPPPTLVPSAGDRLKREELCPYATLHRPAASAADGGQFEAVHCGSLPAALTSPELRAQLEPLYADPRQRLQSLPSAADYQRQRVRSLPVSDEYDSPDSDSSSVGRPGQVRSASLRRGHRSHSREPRLALDSSSSSGQRTPELRSRSLSSRRARRKRRRARPPVLLPPAGDLRERGRSAVELRGLQQQHQQQQQQLAARRAAEPADRADRQLRALAHALGAGRDFSIDV